MSTENRFFRKTNLCPPERKSTSSIMVRKGNHFDKIALMNIKEGAIFLVDPKTIDKVILRLKKLIA